METHSNKRVEGPLDYLITDEEFEAAVNKLKANKSPGIDNILNEVIYQKRVRVFHQGFQTPRN